MEKMFILLTKAGTPVNKQDSYDIKYKEELILWAVQVPGSYPRMSAYLNSVPQFLICLA
jgi:hypothetical protein